MTNAFEIRRATPASPPEKWLRCLAAGRPRGVSPPVFRPPVDDFPPQPYSRSVGVSSAEFVERPPTLLPLPKTPPHQPIF
jgi:hypothetical protein